MYDYGFLRNPGIAAEWHLLFYLGAAQKLN